MSKVITVLLTGALLVGAPLSFAADDSEKLKQLNANLDKVREYVEAKNFRKALEELAWVQRDIEKMDFTATLKFFPEELVGFKGDEPKTQSTMGFSSIERNYRKGNQTIKISLMGGSASAGGAMGGIAALGRFAMMQQAGPGQEMFRLDGRTAMLSEKGKRAELTVHLNSGDMLKFEMSRAADANTLREAAKAFPIKDLDQYRKGG